jgi:parallel beta-helix repeat protein
MRQKYLLIKAIVAISIALAFVLPGSAVVIKNANTDDINNTVSVRSMDTTYSSLSSRGTLYVDDDRPVEWYDTTHVHTIQEGINNAVAGDTIYVYNGTYAEHVTVSKQVNLIGESRENVVVDGSGVGNVFYITTPVTLVSMRSFSITNGQYGIYLYKSTYNTITNCTVYDNTNSGIYLYTNANYNNIRNCTLFNNDYYGVYIRSASYNIITNCTVFNNSNRGITMQSPSNYNKINNCIVYNNTNHGIYLMGLNNHITNCTIYSNTYGVYLSGCSNTNILNCTAYSNNYGIYLQGSSTNSIDKCSAYDNNAGIYISSASNSNTIKNSTAYNNNGHGLYLGSNSNNNVIMDYTAYGNMYGIYIYSTTNHLLRRNVLYNNVYNFAVSGTTVAHYTHNIDPSNTIEGKPIWYLYNANSITLNETDNFGYLGLISCTNITAKNSDVYGIVMVATTQSTISNVSSHNSGNSIYLLGSSNNHIMNCTIYNNSNAGIYLQGSSNNVIMNCRAYNNTNYGFYIYSASNYNVISNCAAYHNGDVGIALSYLSNYNDIMNCVAYNNTNADIYLSSNSDNNITNCSAYNSAYGIDLESSPNNKLRSNTLSSNVYNFAVTGATLADFCQDIDPSNTVNGKPIRYLVGQNNLELNETHSFGYLALISCTNITAKNSDVLGLLLIDTTNSTISNVSSHNSGNGIYLLESSNNVIMNCTAYNNTNYGINLVSSSKNLIMNSTTYNNINHGIYLFSLSTSSEYNNIMNCITYNNTDGISIQTSSSNNISNCIAYDNNYGIYLEGTSNNKLRGNVLYDNVINFGVTGATLAEYSQDIDPSNTIDGKTIRYLVGQNNLELNETHSFGYLALISCTNITAKNSDVFGILLIDTTNSTLSNISSHDSGHGLYSFGSSYNHITDCTTYDNADYGIYLISSSNNTLTSCDAYDNYDGINLVGSSGNTIMDCDAYDNYNGIYIMSSSNSITNCDAYNNVYGIIIFEGAFDITVTNCNAYNNGYGIFFFRCSTNYVMSCNVYNNTEVGIYIYQSSDNSVTNSNVYFNKYGISSTFFSVNNVIYQNNLIDNIYNGYDDCSDFWNDEYPSGGNYWSDYSGVDNYSGPEQNISGSDGIGDTPYDVPEGSNADWYPLMNPLDIIPPVITAVQTTPAVQNTTFPVNITGTVIDNWDLVDTVKIYITGPAGFTLNATMNEGYYYENIYRTVGVYYYFIRATDTSGNIAVSDTYSFIIKLEFDQPISSVNPLPLWNKTVPFTITATAYDNTEVANVTLYYRYSCNGTTWTAWTAYSIDEDAPWSWSFTGSDGYYQFYSIAIDTSGNVEDSPGVADAFTGLDTVPPVTTVELNGTMGTNNWYTSSVVTVTLSATDTFSGNESTWYQLDAGSEQLYSVPFTVSGEGQHMASYYSLDQAGNVENITTIIFKMDTVAPATIYIVDGVIGNQGWYVTNVTVTLTANDTISGVNYTKYKLNEGIWMDYTEPFDVTEDGTYTLSYYSIDLAGNNETTKQMSFQIQHDITPPVTTHDFDGNSGNNEWFVSNVTILLSAIDDSAGVDFTMYKIDDGIWTTYMGLISVTEDAAHILCYYSVDKSGNQEDNNTVTLKIDKTAPTMNLTVEKTGLSKWLLTATVSDETSGIAKVEFYLDNDYLGEVTTAPFTWETIEKGTAQAIVYDNAGNNKISNPVPVSVDFDLNGQSAISNPVESGGQSQSNPSGQSQTIGSPLQSPFDLHLSIITTNNRKG